VEVDNDKENAGDIIVTSFTNYAMPLIRYRIGDTIKISKKNCECDSNCQTIDTIIGRNDNNVITKDGKIIGRLDHIFKGLSGIYEGQIIQESYENFLLKLVPSSKFKKEVELKLVYSLKERVGSNINVKIQLVKEINKTSRGKFKGVISLVNKGKGGL
jgi:phenylacetate-CoA ligase